MNVYDKIAELDKKADDIAKGHFDKPNKPHSSDYNSHTAFGIALDEYELELSKGIKSYQDRRSEVAPIYQEIEDLIRDESGLSKLPKPLADKFYRIAHEQGHSSGYHEIMNYAIDFEDIVEDILKFKNGEI